MSNDAKPYTMEEMNQREVIPRGLRHVVFSSRLIATIEALNAEREAREQLHSTIGMLNEELRVVMAQRNTLLDHQNSALSGELGARLAIAEAELCAERKKTERLMEETARRIESLLSVPGATDGFKEGVRRSAALARRRPSLTLLEAVESALAATAETE